MDVPMKQTWFSMSVIVSDQSGILRSDLSLGRMVSESGDLESDRSSLLDWTGLLTELERVIS